MLKQKMTLYVYALCPYCARVLITLAECKLDCEVVTIDKQNKPDWFIQASPGGRAPLLSIDGHTIFESAIICEYLNDIAGNALLPEQTIIKNINRSWISYAGELTVANFLYGTAKATDKAQRQQQLIDKLSLLDNNLQHQPYFNGDRYSMVDIAFTPAFMWIEFFKQYFAVDILSQFKNCQAWAQQLCQRPSSKTIFSKDYQSHCLDFLREKN